MSDSTPSVSRARAIMLVISLCVNVALIALVAVGVGRMLGNGAPLPGGGGFSPQAILRQAPQEERAHIREIVAAHQGAMHAARVAARRARMEALRGLAATGFTSEAFAKSLAAVRDADAALEGEPATLGDAVAALTPAQRQAILARIRARNPPLWQRLFGPPPF